MRAREPAMATPPDRAPYLRVTCTVLGERVEYVLRTPSLHQVALLASAIGDEQKRALFALSTTVAGGVSLAVAAEALRVGGAGLTELIGALIGVSWRDPTVGLQTPQPLAWEPDHVRAYGAAVFEELHEAGWQLGAVLVCSLALVHQIKEAATLDREVQEQAAFFLDPKGAPRGASPKPSPSSSEAGSEPSLEAS